jgi:hypothetical protein
MGQAARQSLALLGAVAAASCAPLACQLVLPLDDGQYTGGTRAIAVLVNGDACQPNRCGGPAFVEIGSYVGACPSPDADATDPQGIMQILREPLEAHQVVPTTAALSAATATLGGVGRGPHAFFVLLRDAQCAIVASGCADVAISSQTSVTVATQPMTAPLDAFACSGRACACGELAFDAASEGSIASDASCALTLRAAGPLPPLAGGLVQGPAIAETTAGFVIALHDQSSPSSTTHLQSVLLTPNGDLGGTNDLDLAPIEGTCSTAIDENGVGIAVAPQSGAGLVVVAAPSCSKAPSAVGVSFGSDGMPDTSTLGGFSGLPGIALNRDHALSPRFGAGASQFELSCLSESSAFYAPLVVSNGMVTPTMPAQDPGALATALAASPALQARVVTRLGDGALVAETYTGDGAGGPPSTLVATLAGIQSADVVVGSAGGLVAATTAAGVAWQAFPGALASSSVSLAAMPASVDVAVGDGAAGLYVVAVGAPAGVTLFGVDASGQEQFALRLAEQPVVRDLVSGFDGVGLAIASGHGVVAVVWRTTLNLAPGPPGGWALLGCESP